MACFGKKLIRVAVIGALGIGAVAVIAGPHRTRALFHQARSNINCKIDNAITDPVALRSQLRDLESQYPHRIAEVRSDLAELREQIAQLKREQAVNEKVVSIADTDIDRLNSALAQADQATVRQVSIGEDHQIVIVFKSDRLTIDQANNRTSEITATRNAYAARAGDIERDLGYLAQQEERLTSLLNKLDTERKSFQAQLWELDRQVDAVARNDRMITILEKRQHTIDEQSRYRAGSLDQISTHLSDIKAKQEARLAGLCADTSRTNYEDAAKAEIDREQGARKLRDARTTPTKLKTKPSVIEIRPDDAPKPAAENISASPSSPDSLATRDGSKR